MMLLIILKYKLRQYYNALIFSSFSKKLEWFIPLTLIPYCFILTRAMSQIYKRAYNAFGWRILAQLVGANLAMIFFFVLVSAFALTIYRLFQSKDLPLLMSLPTSDGSLFGAKLAESLGDVMRSMVLPLPVFIAFAFVMLERGMYLNTVAFFIGWICILIQLASLSMIFALTIGKFLVISRWSKLSRIIAVIPVVALLLIFISYFQRADSGAEVMPLSSYNRLSILFPTSWLMRSLQDGGSITWAHPLYGFGFALATFACPASAFYLFKTRFRQTWMTTTEASPRRRSQRARVKSATRVGKAGVIVFKDLRIMQREPHMWVGLIVPLILVLILVLFKEQEPRVQAFYVVLVSLMSATSYSISCIGREGKGFSLLRTLPIRISVVMWAKFLLSCTMNLVVTIAFVIILYLTRKSSLSQMWYNIVTATIAGVYFSAFGVALGALFPKFDFTNPMRAVSAAGLFALYLIGPLFGATLIWTKWYPASLTLIPWTGIAVLLLRLGQRKLESVDV